MSIDVLFTDHPAATSWWAWLIAVGLILFVFFGRGVFR